MPRKSPTNRLLQPAEEILLMLLRRALFSAELESGDLSEPIRWDIVFDGKRKAERHLLNRTQDGYNVSKVS